MADDFNVVVNVRDRFAPHAVLLDVTAETEGVKYGLMLSEAGTASFSVRRNSDLWLGWGHLLTVGALVSFERPDGRWPWLGWITRRRAALGSDVVSFELKDHAGALYARARTDWTDRDRRAAVGAHLERAFYAADRRANPPLLSRLVVGTGGPVVDFATRGEKFLDVLNELSDVAGFEWGLSFALTPADAVVTLTVGPRLGRDRRTEVVLEEGRHFQDAEYTQDALGFVGEAVAVGGTGDVRGRPAAAARPTGLRPSFAWSPATLGARVEFNPRIGNLAAVEGSARRLLHASDAVAESVGFDLLEDALEEQILPGDYVTIRLHDVGFGLGLVRVARVLGVQLEPGSGVVDCQVEVVTEYSEQQAEA